MNLCKTLYYMYFELSKITRTFVTEISGESQNKLAVKNLKRDNFIEKISILF